VLCACFGYALEHTLQISTNLAVRNAHHLQTVPGENFIAGGIVFCLICFGMGASIHLDDDHCFVTVEIYDEAGQRFLTPEM
jgi:hypothetical protein